MGVLATLANATQNQRSVKMCVDGALQAEWDKALEEVDDLVTAETSLAAEAATELVSRMEVIREKIIQSEVTFEIQQMPWTARITLQSEHPPREGNYVDMIRGYNIVTYSPEVIKASCRAVVGVDGDRVTDIPDETWTTLLGSEEDKLPGTLNARQVERLVAASVDANDNDTRIPPSARSLLQSLDSGTSLAQPSPGTSPRSDSAAGSRRTSQKSSTVKKAAAKKTGSSAT